MDSTFYKQFECIQRKHRLLPLIVASCALISSLGHLFTIDNRQWNAWTSAAIYLTVIILSLLAQVSSSTLSSSSSSSSCSVWTLRVCVLLLIFDMLVRIHLLYELIPVAFGFTKSQNCQTTTLGDSIWCDLDAESSNAINGSILHFTCLIFESLSIYYAIALLQSKSNHYQFIDMMANNHFLGLSQPDQRFKIESNETQSIDSSIRKQKADETRIETVLIVSN